VIILLSGIVDIPTIFIILSPLTSTQEMKGNFMKYPYYDLSPIQYQNLVVCICKKILGTVTQSYSPGRDDGKDASFYGTAAHIPKIHHING
jgi:hypothetical protein